MLKMGSTVDGTGLRVGLCQIAGFGVRGVEPSGYVTAVSDFFLIYI
jgi:hypothetical protein